MNIIIEKVQLITHTAITDIPRTRIDFDGYQLTETEFIGYMAEEVPNPEPPPKPEEIENPEAEQYQPFITVWTESIRIEKPNVREIIKY